MEPNNETLALLVQGGAVGIAIAELIVLAFVVWVFIKQSKSYNQSMMEKDKLFVHQIDKMNEAHSSASEELHTHLKEQSNAFHNLATKIEVWREIK